MQIDAITPNYAEVFLKKGIDHIYLIRKMTFTELNEMFIQAREDGYLNDLPTNNEIADILTEASSLGQVQFILGRLVGTNNEPVHNAIISNKSFETKTNTNGFFKAAYLSKEPFNVSLPNETEFVIRQFATNFDPEVSFVQTFNIANLEEIKQDKILSEFKGDQLPEISNYPVREELTHVDTFKEGDILLFRQLYKDQNYIKLQSIFNAFDGKTFITNTYKCPASILKSNFNIGDYLLFANGTFTKIKGSRSNILRWKKLRKAQNSIKQPEPGASTTEKINYLKTRLKAIA